MLRIASWLSLAAAIPFVLTGSEASAGIEQEATIQAASAVLSQAMATPDHQIPKAMLADAYGVAIIPNVIKGSFVVGARHGRGLLFIRQSDNVWHAPVFITLTGGNFGWQIGLQSSDIVLVFKTPKSVQGILSGKLTLGADAAAAAGPVGRQAAVATDGQLRAEIYTYSRSRGLFAGVSIDGSVVRIDSLATGNYYRSESPGQSVTVPQSAQQLTQTVAAYAGASSTAVGPDVAGSASTINPTLPSTSAYGSTIVQHHSTSDSDVLRSQLTQVAPELYRLLDDQWKRYLALPSSLFLAGDHPRPDELAAALRNFDRVASDPQFRQLASRPEFQSVYGILRHYQQSFASSPQSLQLPPPPQ